MSALAKTFENMLRWTHDLRNPYKNHWELKLYNELCFSNEPYCKFRGKGRWSLFCWLSPRLGNKLEVVKVQLIYHTRPGMNGVPAWIYYVNRILYLKLLSQDIHHSLQKYCHLKIKTVAMKFSKFKRICKDWDYTSLLHLILYLSPSTYWLQQLDESSMVPELRGADE